MTGTHTEPLTPAEHGTARVPDLDLLQMPVLELAGAPPRPLFANGFAVALFGRASIGATDDWAGHVFGADGPEVLATLAKVQRDGVARRLDVACRTADGGTRPMSALLQPGRARDEHTITWLAILSDRAAVPAGEDLAQVLRAMPAGITVLDEHGMLVYANQAAAAVCGFASEAEMIAVPLRAIVERLRVRDEAGHPIEVDDLLGHMAVPDTEVERVLRIHPATGAGADRLIAVRTIPVREASGRLLRVVNQYRDITELRRAEGWQRFLGEASAALGSSMDGELLLQVVADLAVRSVADWCGIDVCRPDGTACRRVAAARAEGAPPAAELEARLTLPRAPLPEGKPQLIATPGGPSAISVPLSTRGEVIGALTLVTSGQLFGYGEADRTAAEDLARRVSITIDNVRLFGEAQEALRAREDLLAIVSHDLRNPLGVVLASSALLLRSSLPPEREERARRQVEAIQRAGNRMNRLIRDLLDFASIQGGRLTISRRELDAAELAGEVLESLEPLAAQKSIRIEKQQLAGKQLSVSADHDRMVQLFSNVVGNAIKFTPEGGVIRVGADREGELVRFSVADNGPGISREELEHVFDRYYQARRKNREGIGLGLSIAKGIAEAHGGRIWAESEEGKGSTFFITVPAAG